MIDTTTQIESYELEMIPVMFQHKLNRHDVMLHHPEVRRYYDAMTDSVAYQFRAYVLGETQKPITFDAFPTSWWQMLKRDHAPKWFLKRFPVKSKAVTIDAKVLYPDLKISVPQKQSRVTVVFNSTTNPFEP